MVMTPHGHADASGRDRMTDYIWKQTEIDPPSASAIVPAERGRADRPLADRILNMVREHDNGICSCVTLQECDVQVLADVTEALASSPVKPEPSSVASGADDLVSQVEAQQQEIGRLRSELDETQSNAECFSLEIDRLMLEIGRLREALTTMAGDWLWKSKQVRQYDRYAREDFKGCSDELMFALAPTDAGSVRTTKDETRVDRP